MPTLKGSYHKRNIYRPNLIFWVVMGCGKARFGRKGQKKHLRLKDLVSKFVHWNLEATRTWDFEATRDETSWQSPRTSRQSAIEPRGKLHGPEVTRIWTSRQVIQKNPNRSYMVPNGQTHAVLIIWDHLDHLRPFWDWQACHVLPFSVPKGPFWTPLHTWLKILQRRIATAKTASNQLCICKDFACATDS